VLNRGSERSIIREGITERGHGTGRMTRILVALTGAPSWLFTRGRKAHLTVCLSKNSSVSDPPVCGLHNIS